MRARRITVIASQPVDPASPRLSRPAARVSATPAPDTDDFPGFPSVAKIVWPIPVYVDNARCFKSKDPNTLRAGARQEHRWCHLWSDDLETLHRMADLLRLDRSWFHNRSRIDVEPFYHYNLLPKKRALALAYGAVQRSLKDYLREKAARARAGSPARSAPIIGPGQGFGPQGRFV